MIRGTTPTHIFALPFSLELVKTLEITYAQCGKIVLQKGLADCEIEGNAVRLDLTQEETFKLSESMYVDIQLRVLTQQDDALASRIMRVRVEDCLSKEVLK